VSEEDDRECVSKGAIEGPRAGDSSPEGIHPAVGSLRCDELVGDVGADFDRVPRICDAVDFSFMKKSETVWSGGDRKEGGFAKV